MTEWISPHHLPSTDTESEWFWFGWVSYNQQSRNENMVATAFKHLNVWTMYQIPDTRGDGTSKKRDRNEIKMVKERGKMRNSYSCKIVIVWCHLYGAVLHASQGQPLLSSSVLEHKWTLGCIVLCLVLKVKNKLNFCQISGFKHLILLAFWTDICIFLQ